MKQEDLWLKSYYHAKKYYEEHGNLLIPRDYKEVLDNGKIINLGYWINMQRKAYKNQNNKHITKERIDLLNDIKMVWSINDKDTLKFNWFYNYSLAKTYYEEHGNLLITYNYEVSVNDKIIKLGRWIHYQRTLYKLGKLSKKRIDLLNKIKMVWLPENILWTKYYLILCEYKNMYGNLLVPKDYVYKDSDNKKYYLYDWLEVQKNSNLSESRYKLLNTLDLNWNCNKSVKYVDEYTNKNIQKCI